MTNKPDCDIIIIKREVKKMWTSEKMLDEVIKRYGFEDKRTIKFAEKVEKFDNFELSANELIYFYQKTLDILK